MVKMNSKESGRGRELKGKNRSREENQECIARQNSNSTSAIALIHNTRMVSLGAHPDTRSPSRPPGASSGSPESFSPGVDTLNCSATENDYILGKRG